MARRVLKEGAKTSFHSSTAGTTSFGVARACRDEQGQRHVKGFCEQRCFPIYPVRGTSRRMLCTVVGALYT